MGPKKRLSTFSEEGGRPRLESLVDRHHPLVRLSQVIHWQAFEQEWGKLFASERGRPALPTRLIAGLHYLKHTYRLSDEEVVARWVENPYWQYFCGEVYFQHRPPLDPSSLTRWRQRIGEAGCEWLLAETIEAGVRTGTLKQSSLERVTVDTTVQPKAITYPTDAKLYERCRQRLVRLAKGYGLRLRQSYARLGPRALLQVHRYAQARQMRRKAKAIGRLKTFLGRVYRDVQRQLRQQGPAVQGACAPLLGRAERLLRQTRTSRHKLYSVHAPEVECIAKGKAHQRYEFGVKVGLVVTNRESFVVGARAYPGNPYDGHLLAEALEQSEILSGVRAKRCYVDRGFRGVEIPGVAIYRTGQRRGVDTRTLQRELRRRSAIEPVIGHLKTDGLLGRNYLKGTLGDALNVVLCAAGHNIRLILRTLRLLFVRWLARFVWLLAADASPRDPQPTLIMAACA